MIERTQKIHLNNNYQYYCKSFSHALLKIRNKKPEPQKELIKAVLTPATATMIADGSASEVEIAQLANMCSFSPIFFGTESKTIMQTINDIIKGVNKIGLEQVVANAKQTLPPHLRETAVLFAMRIALADGSIDDGEKIYSLEPANDLKSLRSNL